MNRKILFLSLFLLSSYSSFADHKCRPHKPFYSNFEPEKFPKSNNLLRSAGEFPLTCGEKLIIRGKVVDANCIPLSEVKVNIWQVACDGKYPYKPLKNGYKESDINMNSSATFTGAGTAITDNKGEFYFVTTYPGKFRNLKPHIDARLTYNNVYFDTRIYVS